MNQSKFMLLSLFAVLLIFVSGCVSEPEKIAQNENLIAEEPEPVPEKPKDLIPETDNMPAESIVETLSFSWEKDDDARIVDGSVPFIHKLKDGNVRLYYCNDTNGHFHLSIYE